jgi:hypothetical protein
MELLVCWSWSLGALESNGLNDHICNEQKYRQYTVRGGTAHGISIQEVFLGLTTMDMAKPQSESVLDYRRTVGYKCDRGPPHISVVFPVIAGPSGIIVAGGTGPVDQRVYASVKLCSWQGVKVTICGTSKAHMYDMIYMYDSRCGQ